MSELDERRIAEIAKEAPRVLRGSQGEAVRADARRVVEAMGLMQKRKQGVGDGGGEP
ncbi:hypothetical protein [Streptomyces sp. CB02115]|uniref:hypothetical protein n=1 Tax=Streptomyces sp. CB02115 TaxID=1703939 RepID=UPI00130172BB|nr:hypothetical protein [Streptomyces sp. CB02115]